MMRKRDRQTTGDRNFCWWCFAIVIGTTMVNVPTVQCLAQLMVLGAGRVGRVVMDSAARSSTFDRCYGVVRTTTPTAPDSQAIHSCSGNDSNMKFLNWDSDMKEIVDRTKECTHLLVTLPPAVQVENCAAIAGLLSAGTWIGVVSTTGVYGNHNGAWVTERSECRGRKNYLEHEQVWAERSTLRHCRLNVFRCAGIYGPTASALHTIFRDGISKEDSERPDFPISRIHVDDIVSAISASMALVSDGDDEGTASGWCCYNLSDDEPAPRSIVLAHAAELLESIGVILPDNGDEPKTNGGSRVQRRKTDNKRVSNRLMKEKLLSMLTYPTYRSGLSAILTDKSCPWWQQ
jgi:hypothetical protein